MKKFIVMIAFLMSGMASTALYAQQLSATVLVSQQVSKDSLRAQRKAMAEAEDKALHIAAVQALKDKQFVLEADQLIFKRGEVAYVNSNTNFVCVDGEKGSVQVAFVNSPFAGPNGIGGITVDGQISGVKMKEGKKGSVTYSFNVQGTGISAQVFLTLNRGSNQATVSISPNFNSQTLTLHGELVPMEQSTVFKARSL